MITQLVNYCNTFVKNILGGERVKEKWTGDLIGNMHVHEVTYDELAAELGITKSYVSMILNGSRTPANAKERLQEAYSRILEKRKAKTEGK